MNKYSIILPVRNGGAYLKECVSSILAQTYTHFNLIVLENGSSDGSRQWLESVPDERILLLPSERPLNIEENWRRISSLQKNEFMTMIGHDDLLRPDYLEIMHGLVQKQPSATLFQAHFNYIDAQGREIRKCKPMKARMDGASFLAELMNNNLDLMGTGFLMRSRDYDRLGGLPDYPNLLFADFELWVKLTSEGSVAIAREEGFSFRVHASTTTTSSDMKMLAGFGRLVNFLAALRDQRPDLAEVIEKNAGAFLSFYCKGLSHRLLRTPLITRNGLTVSEFIANCRQYAHWLSPESTPDPAAAWSVRLGGIIDQSTVLRTVFLFFKRLFPKPVLK